MEEVFSLAFDKVKFWKLTAIIFLSTARSVGTLYNKYWGKDTPFKNVGVLQYGLKDKVTSGRTNRSDLHRNS